MGMGVCACVYMCVCVSILAVEEVYVHMCANQSVSRVRSKKTCIETGEATALRC
ncbi:hypothetical protein OrNV_gp050 [Oryctes rhinoceros nudivirus]|uniref:Uncharacterized protein n=1 Tax=Oryctes rhinoceros nudivirus TaxID=92521 RepID=B7SV71_9VIRU|nr:hypothetical protein OrNV_gp050 [Oryctes rhinoceros nudivirus]ACH96180.1 unknown [Oryctes rhinoceros nudivirus]WAQ80198.1 hypothetical protein GC_00069 [Oryctes rhinoceros nudivirus]